MIRIKQISKSNIPLHESSLAELNSVRVRIPREAKKGDDLLPYFTYLYEVEYKYNKLVSYRFSGSLDRKENIVNILKELGEKLIHLLSPTFLTVFEEWLTQHGIQEPRKWAYLRFHDEKGKSMLEEEGLLYTMDIIAREIEGYNPSVRTRKDLFCAIAVEKEELFTDLKAEVEKQTSMNYLTPEQLYDELERMGVFEDEARKKIPLVDTHEMMMTAYEKILFPAWYKFWKAKGLDKTHANIKKITSQLKSIARYPVEEQFMILNIAKNTNHQTGSMMEYYEDMWGVDYAALQKLSNLSTKEWDNELEEVGVLI